MLKPQPEMVSVLGKYTKKIIRTLIHSEKKLNTFHVRLNTNKILYAASSFFNE